MVDDETHVTEQDDDHAAPTRLGQMVGAEECSPDSGARTLASHVTSFQDSTSTPIRPLHSALTPLPSFLVCMDFFSDEDDQPSYFNAHFSAVFQVSRKLRNDSFHPAPVRSLSSLNLVRQPGREPNQVFLQHCFMQIKTLYHA
jgi:hypothetical protein